jgi:hypothetical protein
MSIAIKRAPTKIAQMATSEAYQRGNDSGTMCRVPARLGYQGLGKRI